MASLIASVDVISSYAKSGYRCLPSSRERLRDRYDHAFGLLLDIYDEAVDTLLLAADYEPSIEGTFASVSRPKLERAAASGVRRLSLGLQTTSGDVLCRFMRGLGKTHSLYRPSTAACRHTYAAACFTAPPIVASACQRRA